MGWHMKLVICVQLAYVSVCLTQLSVVHEWTSLDLQLPPEYGPETRESIKPFEINSWLLYKDRMFVTLRIIPYGFAYTDNLMSPLFRPYMSFENLVLINDDMIKLDKVRVDRCDRLWMISLSIDYARMIVFDLKTDSVLRNSFIPELLYPYDMIIDDSDCDNEYVYISTNDGVWTYSWAEDDSWRHNISVPISSMILAPNSIVYFNVAGEPAVYYMSTTHLRDKSNKSSDIRQLGRSKKLNLNLASSALDAKSDVLYYFTYDNSTVIHAVPCWTSERCSTNCQDVRIDPTHELKCITVDENGYLWAITSRSSYEDEEINYRLLSVPDRSTCIESNAKDTINTSTGVESNAKDTTNTSTGVESNTKDTTNTSTGVESNAKDTTDTSTDVEPNAKDTTNTSTGVESNAKDTTNTSTGVESNTKDTTNTSTGVESNAKDTTDTSTDVEPNAKDTTNTENIHEITTPASSATEQTSTLGSVPKHTTVNIVDTTAGTPNSNITQAVGGTNTPYLLFSFANTTFNFSINFTINNFTNNYFH